MSKGIKKSFYIAPALVKAWEDFHLPSKDFSPSAAAGMLAYLIADFPANDGKSVREHFRQLASNDDIKYDNKTKLVTGKSADTARQILIEAVLNSEILREIGSQGISKAEFLRLLTQVKEKASRG